MANPTESLVVLLCLILCGVGTSVGRAQIGKLDRQSSCVCNLRHRPVCTRDGEEFPNACAALCKQKAAILLYYYRLGQEFNLEKVI